MGIVPKTASRKIELLKIAEEEATLTPPKGMTPSSIHDPEAIQASIKEWEQKMKRAAKELRFEDAIEARNTWKRLLDLEMNLLNGSP
jgi:excinuclease UvrABC helicase subunit UvrB